MTIHIFFLFPETAGKTLEEVEDMFLSDVKPWRTKVQYGRSRQVESGRMDEERKVSHPTFQHEEKTG